MKRMGMSSADTKLFHVLAVDDSMIDRKLIERLLKTCSYKVTTVDSVCKALEFLGLNLGEAVNLVITDYCMPGMTGYDLLKKIKESSSLSNIPVVIMSSENVPSRINRCLEEGAEEFFLKPVRLSDVNKLKSHIMKTKCNNQQKPEQLENQEIKESIEEEKHQNQDSSEIQLQPQPKRQRQQTQSNNAKRKAMEEGLSPDRTRPRYNSLTVV